MNRSARQSTRPELQVRIASSGEVLVIGVELLVDVEAVDVELSVVGESMAITLSWARFHPLAAGQ